MPPDSLALWGRGSRQDLARGVAAPQHKAIKVRGSETPFPVLRISSPLGGRVATLQLWLRAFFFRRIPTKRIFFLTHLLAGIYGRGDAVSQEGCVPQLLLVDIT